MQIRARDLLLIQLDQHILLKRLLDEKFVLAIGPVAPENILRLCQLRDVLDPVQHRLIDRFAVTNASWRPNGGGDVFHE